jgi:hypothetical protein
MTQHPKEKSNGCLWIFILTVITVICFGVIKVITGLSDLLAIAIGVFLALLITLKIAGRPSLKSFFWNAILIFFVLFGFKFIGSFLMSLITNIELENPTFTNEDFVTTNVLIENNDTIPVYTSTRNWKDNYGNNYSGDLTVREKDYKKLHNHLQKYQPPSSNNFWGNLYNYMDEKDSPKLDLIINMFSKINENKKLNEMEFAEMVITCVQDIPYSFVFQESCMSPENYEDAIKNILKQCPDCCIGDIIYGVQNSVSFIQNLKGDCDTRTVLLYSILKQFNYDVAILNSDFYRHSILGINIPGSGSSKTYNGKKYILWETTAKYFKAGDLPVNFNDVTHWNIVLTSK